MDEAFRNKSLDVDSNLFIFLTVYYCGPGVCTNYTLADHLLLSHDQSGQTLKRRKVQLVVHADLSALRRALKACGRYGYQAEFTGVGQAVPHLHLHVGFCSQIALFRRLAGGGGAHPASSADAGEVFSYKLVSSS